MCASHVVNRCTHACMFSSFGTAHAHRNVCICYIYSSFTARNLAFSLLLLRNTRFVASSKKLSCLTRPIHFMSLTCSGTGATQMCICCRRIQDYSLHAGAAFYTLRHSLASAASHCSAHYFLVNAIGMSGLRRWLSQDVNQHWSLENIWIVGTSTWRWHVFGTFARACCANA